MAHVSFRIDIDCDDERFHEVVPHIYGDIKESAQELFDKEESKEFEANRGEIKIGEVAAYLVQRGRAMDEKVYIWDALAEITRSDWTLNCIEALIDVKTNDWKKSIDRFYSGGIYGPDVLYISTIELKPKWRGKEIGAQVVRSLIGTFASNCGLVVCKPFPLQYDQADAPEKKWLADSAKVETFWVDLGFRKLPNCVFFGFAPALKEQPPKQKPQRRQK